MPTTVVVDVRPGGPGEQKWWLGSTGVTSALLAKPGEHAYTPAPEVSLPLQPIFPAVRNTTATAAAMYYFTINPSPAPLEPTYIDTRAFITNTN